MRDCAVAMPTLLVYTRLFFTLLATDLALNAHVQASQVLAWQRVAGSTTTSCTGSLGGVALGVEAAAGAFRSSFLWLRLTLSRCGTALYVVQSCLDVLVSKE